jgi:hypothetical protein
MWEANIAVGVELEELGFCDDERRAATATVARLICERVAQWESEGSIGHA